MPNYIKLSVTGADNEELSEILIAELAEADFESFDEAEGIINAYIQENNYNSQSVEEIFKQEIFSLLKYSVTEIKAENWNSVWESNFEPVVIGEECIIYAAFHNNLPDAKYKIEINPKMTFGTGHHETTHLCSEAILNIDVKGKQVLDMGCGTGILGILAALKGASHITAIDNDLIAVENAVENAQLNNVDSIMEIFEGNGSSIEGKQFDVIIANINRNVLLNDMENYVKSLNKGGILILSGFYKEDIALLEETAASLGLVKNKEACKNRWAMLQLNE